MTKRWTHIQAGAVLALVLTTASAPPLLAASAPESPGDLPAYLQDRGSGIATSLFGTYVRSGELLFYPFYEYVKNRDQEYKPSELGYLGGQDFRGRRVEKEGLIFLSYGLSDHVAFEFESALYSTASLRKATTDTSGVPSLLKESGFGDTQAELRWRWSKETARRPEIWGYSEVVFPFQKEGILIGTADWELIQGLGLTKGFRWGTLTTRASVTYSGSDRRAQLGEYEIEYLKKVSRAWRAVIAMEGEQDEMALIGEAQWQIAPSATLKLNNGFGITSKAPDLAPEVGIVFSF